MGVHITAPLDPLILKQREIEKLKMRLSASDSLNKKLLRRGGMAFEEAIEELQHVLKIEGNSPFKFVPTQIARQKPLAKAPVSPNHKETAVLVLSDWHVSERVRAADSNGVNEYSSPIAANRLYEVVDTFKRIVRMHQAMYPIEKIWVPVLGDMINGTIHPELALTNDLTDPAATVLASRLLIAALLELKTLGIPIEVDCIVGNHPRMLAKMPTKRQAHTSFDWVIYMIAEDYFRKDKTITFRVHTGQIGLVKQYNWNYVLEHGIDVKNGREEEFEDRIRALFDDPTFREANPSYTGASFDQIIIGNLHKPAMLERTIKNGALTGQNELGQSWRLKPIRAQQMMFGISKSHVRTWSYGIDVTHIKDGEPSNPFSEFTVDYMKEHGRA